MTCRFKQLFLSALKLSVDEITQAIQLFKIYKNYIKGIIDFKSYIPLSDIQIISLKI